MPNGTNFLERAQELLPVRDKLRIDAALDPSIPDDGTPSNWDKLRDVENEIEQQCRVQWAFSEGRKHALGDRHHYEQWQILNKQAEDAEKRANTAETRLDNETDPVERRVSTVRAEEYRRIAREARERAEGELGRAEFCEVLKRLRNRLETAKVQARTAKEQKAEFSRLSPHDQARMSGAFGNPKSEDLDRAIVASDENVAQIEREIVDAEAALTNINPDDVATWPTKAREAVTSAWNSWPRLLGPRAERWLIEL